MAEIRIVISGDERMSEEVYDETYARVKKVMVAGAFMFAALMKTKLSQPGSGRVYRSKGGKGKHQASAPGEPPAPDLGDYRASWMAWIVEKKNTIEIHAGSRLWKKFGRRLELGGADGRGIYIAPRPHVRPVVDAVERWVRKQLTGREE